MPKAKRSKVVKKAKGGKKARFVCEDCGFVAAHAMGLGRHRSARHGAVSVRARRSSAPARVATPGWLTRQQAAERAGVHYNTIRLWERGGLIRVQKHDGTRGALLDASDLAKVLAERGAPTAGSTGVDLAALKALEVRFDHLLDGLERLVAGARGASAPRRRGRPLGSKNKKTVVAETPVKKAKATRAKPGQKKSAQARTKKKSSKTARRKPSSKRGR